MKPKPSISFSLCYICGTSWILIIAGIIILSTWPYIYEFIMNSNTKLSPDSNTYTIWKKNPIPLSLDFYFFNWTNPEAVNNITIKPKFQQMGPYKFSETKEKVNITWNNNGTVSFNQLKYWYFDEKNSNGSLTDAVTSLNPVSLAASYASRHWSYFIKSGLSMSLNTLAPTVHMTRTVGQLLFQGYDDNLLNVAKTMPFLSDASLPPMDKFGWFYSRNGSADYEGTYNMGTGTSNSTLGRLQRWKHESRTPYYPGACGSVEASAGEFFKQNLKKDDIISFFSSDLCRKVELEFEKEEIVNNIVGYKYSAGDRLLDNGTKIVENKCFCDGDCMPSGALNVSACRYGSPAFVSLPNFYKADPIYINSLNGVKSEPDKNDFYMIFEPTTGIPLEVSVRLQLNLLMQPMPNIRLYENVPKVYFPMLWFEQVVQLPSDITFYLKLLINLKIISVAVGITLISIGLILQYCFWYKICTVNLCGHKKSKQTSREMDPLREFQNN